MRQNFGLSLLDELAKHEDGTIFIWFWSRITAPRSIFVKPGYGRLIVSGMGS